MSQCQFLVDLERKEILIMSPIPLTLLLKIAESFAKKVCGFNAVLAGGEEAKERGAVMVFRSGDK